ncbi:heterogeneous nuclear ribonucleoprotein R-like [Contarinia nasturtii]|uniref:heterogeneous nuclear ribonucleoprotein R-like n=1 Tax=Contarinia nasturtii TaxID=265458 RepID=UPI0012D3A99B|nr:heterogeneous nuclear ribonucleoprotein R-like [Contarinia nasturtii]
MENIESTEQSVVLQLNGIKVDMDVIAKDAELEMNNNESVKPSEIVKKFESEKSNEIEDGGNDISEKSIESKTSEANADDDTDNENKTEAETDAESENGTMSNGATNQSNEGDSKVENASDSSDDKSETTEPSEPSSYTTGTDSIESGTSSPKSLESASSITENVDEKPKTSADTVLSEERSDSEQQKENTVTGTNEAMKQEQQQQQQNDQSESPRSDSSKKSPRKKSLNKKRKNRTRSQKKDVDYSDLDKYTVSVSQRQRRYFLLVTRGRNVPAPSDECEIFCTNIPINVREGELIPLFERYGKIWELRLMMSFRNPKRNAGFAFVRYTSHESAQEATEKLNDYEIVPGKHLSIRLSQPNLSLFVGNIHRGLTREQIHEKISNRTKGLVKTFVKSSMYEDTKNCGFCFLEYDCHTAALNAKRLLNKGNVWGRQLFVDWAQRRKQPDENDLNESKTIFINYLPKETTDEVINETLSSFGTIEKVTKIKDYAFVLFSEHQAATDAMNGVDKTKLGCEKVEISLAMPKMMKTSRPRNSSFSYRHAPQNGRRNNQYKRYRPSYRTSKKFSMRQEYMSQEQQPVTKKGNATADTAVEHTTTTTTTNISMPAMDQTSAETLVN